MSRICGECARYRRMPFCEDICTMTGKVVPYLAQKECFMAKTEQDTNLLNQDTNEMAENTNIKTKVCKDCGRELPIDHFHRQAKSKDGYMHICKDCKRKHVLEGVKKGENELLERIFGKEAVEKTDGEIFTENEYDRLQEYEPRELVEHLRSQGWEVTCTKTITI